MGPKLILFDFDGTLADSFSATLAIANRMAVKYGFSQVNDIQAAAFRNLGARQILRESGIPLHRLPSWIRELKEEQRHEIPAMKPPEGLTEALFALKEAGLSLGIVTSNSRGNVQLFLESNGWTQQFDHLESGSSLFGKSRLIKRVITRAGYPVAEVVYVGDEERDVEAARQANVSPVAVSWGYNSREVLARSQPDHLLDRPEELLRLFLPS